MSLPDLSQAVADKFNEIVASGAIEKMLGEHLEATINTILKEQFRTYGAFGKALEPKIEEALQIADLKDLPKYGVFIQNIVRKNVDSQLHGAYMQKLESDIAELFIEPPAEYSLEQLVEDFKKHVREHAYSELDARMTLILEASSYGFWHVEMDKDEDKDKYHCAVRFAVNKEGVIYSLSIDGDDMKKDLFVGPFDSFERFLFRMYVMGTKLVIPAHTEAHDFDLSLRADD